MYECGELAYYYKLCTSLFNLDIEMGRQTTVCFAISKINNPIRYITNVTNGKIPVSV